MASNFIVPLVTRFMGLYPQLRVDIELSNRPTGLVHESWILAIRLGQDSRLVATPGSQAHVYVRLALLPGTLRAPP